MRLQGFRRLKVGVILVEALLAWGSLKAQNGIFADFSTSLGSFTCQLDYTNSPSTVANFVGMATGERAWLDLPTGRALTKPFYNGLTFHRVIAGFMIQGGSPDGAGDDGPGYAILDEVRPGLVFTNPGVLAMANSGPNSGGSQVFITVAPYTSGNSNYTIFGHVTAGLNVVSNVNLVATDTNNKPLTNVVIQQVVIRRVGTAAEAFDVNAQGLPVVTNGALQLGQAGQQISISFSNHLFADNRWYSATNLSSQWTPRLMGIELVAPLTNSFTATNSGGEGFFRLAQVQYASSTFSPKQLFGRTLALTFTSTLTGTMTILFDGVGGGDYTFPPHSPGSVTSYSWSQEPYRGWLYPIYFSTPNPMTLRMDFSTATNGSFSGTFYQGGIFPSAIGGNFTVSGP